MRSCSESFQTSGDGLWSRTEREVKIVGIDADSDTQEMRVYFDVSTWDISYEGLIYTDPGFLADLRDYLKRAGYAGTVEYSEQGMQGVDFVSFDADAELTKSWSV